MRYERRRKKKKRKWKAVFSFFLLLIIFIVGYSYVQYKNGLSQSLEKAEGEERFQEEYEFNGRKDKHGGINILILGSDSREGEQARADTIMIGSYNPGKESYKLISIMRDTYINIPGHGENRINAAFALGGPELLRETIKENFDLDIQYYAILDFDGFIHLIDEAFPNGVKIEVEKEMSKNIGVTLKPGVQYLDGEHLLGYVRFRHDAVGDFGRVQRQQKVVRELGSQLANFGTLAKLPKLIGVVTPFINTNMNGADMIYIGKDFLKEKNRNVETLRIPVDGAWENKRIRGAEVLAINLDENKAALHEFLSK